MHVPIKVSDLRISLVFTILSSHLLVTPVKAEASLETYFDLPLEDLLSMEVTSVSKKSQRLNEAAAAIFVITQEDIRRSGVTSIPEALRMAPGIQVARIDANKWAISSRGFNAQFANKLLVLIDGRSVYTPSYSGVYWDAQDTLLEDIDRIEVIRGPGATLWGANAVNGVINIITKQAAETQGGLLIAGAGNEEKVIAGLRYGADLNPETQGRLYVKYNDRDSSYAPAFMAQAQDDWRSLRGGFRIDSQATETDSWTLQGDIYQADQNQLLNLFQDPSDPTNLAYAPRFYATNLADEIESSGWNLLARWDKALSRESNTTLQIYYDHTNREEGFLAQQHDTLDIDFQHQIQAHPNHEVVWGLGYRRIQDDFDNSFAVSFAPDSRSVDLYSAFLQDEIELVPAQLRLTLGSKFEHNDYTGFEIQPSARLVWLPKQRHTLWASVSRAVRTPSRAEDSISLVTEIVPTSPLTPPLIIGINGQDDFEAEELIAYELGYRVQPSERLSLDLALFYNDYDNLQTIETVEILQLMNPLDPFGPPLLIPTTFEFANLAQGDSLGLELAVDWRFQEWWRMQANYSFIEVSASLHNASNDYLTVGLLEGSSPRHQVSLRSMMDLSHAVSLDFWAYYVDELSNSSLSLTGDNSVSDYTSLNLRLAWQAQDNLELSLVGHNLLDNRHQEFIGENLLIQTEIERSIYGMVRWDF
jgi:iron complex outermembrane receptor protein